MDTSSIVAIIVSAIAMIGSFGKMLFDWKKNKAKLHIEERKLNLQEDKQSISEYEALVENYKELLASQSQSFTIEVNKLKAQIEDGNKRFDEYKNIIDKLKEEIIKKDAENKAIMEILKHEREINDKLQIEVTLLRNRVDHLEKRESNV